jgi:hypothetical protein
MTVLNAVAKNAVVIEFDSLVFCSQWFSVVKASEAGLP